MDRKSEVSGAKGAAPSVRLLLVAPAFRRLFSLLEMNA